MHLIVILSHLYIMMVIVTQQVTNIFLDYKHLIIAQPISRLNKVNGQ